MDVRDEIKIVITDGEYMESYAPYPKDKRETEKKVKRGILKNLGMKEEEIDRCIEQLELELVDGADGRFDDGPYTPVRLVKKIQKEPPVIEVDLVDIPLSEKESPRKPHVIEVDPVDIPLSEKESPRKPRQTMIQQYYGDKQAEHSRVKVFDRFKSHITQKAINVYDEKGTKRSIQVYTVEDYKGKEQDVDELLLSGYQTRLERLSRAHQRDLTPYKIEYRRLLTSALKEIMEQYEEMHEVDSAKAEQFKSKAMEEMTPFNDPEFEKKAIQALIDKDTEFIETNNYSYNSRQNTAENLKTLGKFGEKSVRAQVSTEQSFLQKAGLHTLNALLEIRNHTTAPVNKAIGTYIASPIFRALHRVTKSKSKEPVNVDGFLITPMEDMLAISQKHSRGMFKNKPSHRYHARKDFFIQQMKQEFKMQQKGETDKEKEGKETVERTTLGKLLKLSIIPRIKSIINFKEGNVAILNAGLHDIEVSTAARQSQMNQKRHRIIDSTKRIAAYEKEISDLRALEKVTKDSKQKEQIARVIEQREVCKLRLEARLAEASRVEIDSVSTDAVSMSQHDKANKANITGVIKGVKTAGRVATGVFISKYLYREIANKSVTPDKYKYIPGKTKEIQREVTEQVIETVPGMDKAGIGNITLQDIYSKGKGQLSYYANNLGRKIDDNTSYFRGGKFEYQGEICSGSDGRGFDPTVLTDVKIDQAIDGNTSVVSLIQEILQDKLGKQFTTDQIEEMIATREISGIEIWRSALQDGVPSGWINASEIIPEIINNGSHEVTRDVVKTITETITTPGKSILIPGTEHIDYISELNPIVVAAEAGLGVLEATDWNELLRFTRSQESIQRRQPRILELMKEENDRKRTASKGKEEINGKKKDETNSATFETTKVKKKREIKSFQRNNKSKNRRYTYFSEKMKKASEREATKRDDVTIWEGFTGTRKQDFASGYDENLLGVNDSEKEYDEYEKKKGKER